VPQHPLRQASREARIFRTKPRLPGGSQTHRGLRGTRVSPLSKGIPRKASKIVLKEPGNYRGASFNPRLGRCLTCFSCRHVEQDVVKCGKSPGGTGPLISYRIPDHVRIAQGNSKLGGVLDKGDRYTVAKPRSSLTLSPMLNTTGSVWLRLSQDY